jgi:hypothetical protein
VPHHTDEIDDEDWDETGGEEDAFDDGEEVTVPCPYCRRPILEDSPRCPYCENYLSREDASPARKPLWFLVGAAAVLAVVYIWIRT